MKVFWWLSQFIEESHPYRWIKCSFPNTVSFFLMLKYMCKIQKITIYTCYISTIEVHWLKRNAASIILLLMIPILILPVAFCRYQYRYRTILSKWYPTLPLTANQNQQVERLRWHKWHLLMLSSGHPALRWWHQLSAPDNLCLHHPAP